MDSTASPMCALLPLNSWGAYIIGLLATLGITDTMGVMVKALPFNFYCIIALAICLVVIFRNWNIGSMKTAEQSAAVTNDEVEQADEKTATP